MNYGLKQTISLSNETQKMEDFVGQEHVLGKDKILYRTIQADRLSSIILWGPTGCGKTSLARVISEKTSYQFYQINAVTAGIADIKKCIEEARNAFLNPSGKCILFIDEIHRFNKLQQDALLPYVEDGTIILIGATTENPYFEVNKALISRSMVIKLKPLSDQDVVKILKHALQSEEGLAQYPVQIQEETLEKIAQIAGGDVRTALNGLEIAVLTTEVNKEGKIPITNAIVADCFQNKKIQFDKKGDSHYDNISAMIKAMRGTDPDAAVFYLARAIAGGEDSVFLARRIVICAAEDVGMADPNALVIANAAMQAVHYIGMPEARIILSEAAVYVAKAPKSNAAYKAINKALEDVQNKDTGSIPMAIRNAPVEGMKCHGYHEGYKYPHDYPNHYVEQQYLPDPMVGTVYYQEDESIKSGKTDKLKEKR